MTRTARLAFCLLLPATLLFGVPVQAQDMLCEPLRTCADGVLPNVDDGTSPSEAIAEKVVPLCQPQATSCNDQIFKMTQQAQTNNQNADPQTTQTVTSDLGKPEGRVKVDKTVMMIVKLEVELYRHGGSTASLKAGKGLDQNTMAPAPQAP